MKEKTFVVSIRFPEAVKKALEDWAADEDRTFSSQVVHLLRQAVKERTSKVK
jgi:hypothetical protein